MTIPVVQFGVQGPAGPVAASVTNIAALTAQTTTGYLAGTLVFVASAKTSFSLDPTSTATVDNNIFVAAVGGGRWVRTGFIYAAISLYTFGPVADNVTDDSGVWQNAVTALAGTGVALFVPYINSGTYLISNPVTFQNPIHVIIEPGVSLRSGVAGVGFTNAMFFAQGLNYGAVASTTVNGNTTKGSRTFVVASGTGLAIGQSIMLGSIAAPNNAQQFMITNVAGTTITVDEPIALTFLTGDTVRTFNPPTEIRIYGNGAHVSGSGGTFFEFAAAQRCVVQGFVVPTTTVTSYVGSMDVGGRDNLWDLMVVNGGGTAQYGLAFESNARGGWRDCRATNCTNSGFWHSGGSGQSIAGCSAYNNTSSGYIAGASSSGDVDSVQRCTMSNCNFEKNGVQGIALQGVRDFQASNVICSYNGSYGVYVYQGGSGALNCYANLADIACNDTGQGIFLDVGAHRVSVSNLTTDRCTTNGIYINGAGTMLVANWMGENCCLGGGQMYSNTAGSASDIVVIGARWKVTQTCTGTWIGVNNNSATGTIQLDNVVMERTAGTGNMYGVFTSNPGTIKLRGVRTVGALTGGIFASGAGAAVTQLDAQCDFTSCSTPITMDASAVLTHSQMGGETKITASGTSTLTHVQAANSGIETSTQASGTVTVTAAVLIPGMAWDCRNNNTGSSTTTFFGVTVAVGKSARVKINGAGAGERVTADT